MGVVGNKMLPRFGGQVAKQELRFDDDVAHELQG
jgi:hypothetical protein